MKSSYLRAGAALACALTLSACGGSDGNLLLGGQFSGVTKTGLVLTNNGGSDLAVTPTSTGTGDFHFPGLLESDDKYDVQVKSKPSNAEKCEAFYNTGRMIYDELRVRILCTLKKHELRGTVTGLTGANLVLLNGSTRVPVPAGATTFSMLTINEDAPYGITILTQPDNQTCTIANGTGTMGPTDVTNVAVTCGPRT